MLIIKDDSPAWASILFGFISTTFKEIVALLDEDPYAIPLDLLKSEINKFYQQIKAHAITNEAIIGQLQVIFGIGDDSIDNLLQLQAVEEGDDADPDSDIYDEDVSYPYEVQGLVADLLNAIEEIEKQLSTYLIDDEEEVEEEEPQHYPINEHFDAVSGISPSDVDEMVAAREVKADQQFFQPQLGRSQKTLEMIAEHESAHTVDTNDIQPLNMAVPHRKAIIAAAAPTSKLLNDTQPWALTWSKRIAQHSHWNAQKDPETGEPIGDEPFNTVEWQFSEQDTVSLTYTPAPGHLGGARVLEIGEYPGIYGILQKITGAQPDKERDLAKLLIEHSATGKSVRELLPKYSFALSNKLIISLTRIAMLMTVHEVSRRQYPGSNKNGPVPYIPFGLQQAQQLALVADEESEVTLEDCVLRKSNGKPAKLGPATGRGVTSYNRHATRKASERLRAGFWQHVVANEEQVAEFKQQHPGATVMPRTELFHKRLQHTYGVTSDSEGEAYSDPEVRI